MRRQKGVTATRGACWMPSWRGYRRAAISLFSWRQHRSLPERLRRRRSSSKGGPSLPIEALRQPAGGQLDGLQMRREIAQIPGDRLQYSCSAAAAAGCLNFAGSIAAGSHSGEEAMEYRQLGASGFTVPVLSYGTGTFAAERARGFAAVYGAEAR